MLFDFPAASSVVLRSPLHPSSLAGVKVQYAGLCHLSNRFFKQIGGAYQQSNR